MYKKLALGLLFAVLTAPFPALAAQPPVNAGQMAPLQYLVGTWHCTWQSGSQSGSEDQIFTPALDGAWLEEREVVSSGGVPVVATIHYTGYDPHLKEYVHVGPDADGSYELAHSPDGDAWISTDGNFVHKKVSDVERTMTETSGTARVTMTCAKAGNEAP